MTSYRLFGAETSPYSLKVRSFLRYKNADFDWVLRSAATDDEFNKHAILPTVPLLFPIVHVRQHDKRDNYTVAGSCAAVLSGCSAQSGCQS